ncbi:uncharacterized protein TM35_000292630, partial [Trypanosoma theileri]
VVVLVIVAVILFFVLRQRPQQEQPQPRKKVPMDTVESQSTSNTTTVETTSNPLTTTTTTEVTTNSAVSRNTARSVQSGDNAWNSDDIHYGHSQTRLAMQSLERMTPTTVTAAVEVKEHRNVLPRVTLDEAPSRRVAAPPAKDVLRQKHFLRRPLPDANQSLGKTPITSYVLGTPNCTPHQVSSETLLTTPVETEVVRKTGEEQMTSTTMKRQSDNAMMTLRNAVGSHPDPGAEKNAEESHSATPPVPLYSEGADRFSTLIDENFFWYDSEDDMALERKFSFSIDSSHRDQLRRCRGKNAITVPFFSGTHNEEYTEGCHSATLPVPLYSARADTFPVRSETNVVHYDKGDGDKTPDGTDESPDVCIDQQQSVRLSSLPLDNYPLPSNAVACENTVASVQNNVSNNSVFNLSFLNNHQSSGDALLSEQNLRETPALLRNTSEPYLYTAPAEGDSDYDNYNNNNNNDSDENHRDNENYDDDDSDESHRDNENYDDDD